MWRSAVQLRAGLRYGGIAQLVEHLLCKQGVKSSNLFISTQKDSFLWKLSFFVISALPSPSPVATKLVSKLELEFEFEFEFEFDFGLAPQLLFTTTTSSLPSVVHLCEQGPILSLLFTITTHRGV